DALLAKTNLFFGLAEKIFTSVYLPWKYGPEDQSLRTASVPSKVRIDRTRISFPHMGIYFDGDRIGLGIKGTALARYWLQQISSTNQSKEVFKKEFAELFGEDNDLWKLVERFDQR